jgi:hypothetical protein
MPGIKKRRDYFVTTSDNNYYYSDSEDFSHSYCPNCESYGHYNLLKERVYQDSELINGDKPHDSENWLQCYRCGLIVATVHAKQDSKITGIKDVPESIYDTKKLTILPFNERSQKNQRKYRQLIKSRTIRKNPEEDDPDIQRHLEKGSRLISYQSTNEDG